MRLRGLTKRFGSVMAVEPLDLDIPAGELVVLVGPSGCGKTTVLRMIAGLEDPTAGEIFIGDRNVAGVDPADRDIAMVFQNYALYPHMTVAGNLAFGLKMRGVAKAEVASRVERAAAMLGMSELLHRRPEQLSGGQRQRVALGRAMVREPRVFLFDEPLSNLDAQLRTEMRREIAELHRRLDTTMVYVTHDQVEAMTLGDRVAVLDRGVLQQCAPPMEAYRNPANLFVAGFLGTPRINMLEGRVEVDARFVSPTLTLRLERAVEPGAATLAVRPEDLTLRDPGGEDADLVCTVERVEALGNEVLVYVGRDDGLEWIVRAPADWRGTPGETVGVAVDRARAHLFPAGDGSG